MAALVSGGPLDEVGRFGATNGAAMRIAPVGLIISTGDLDALVDLVVEASRVTHHTGVAIAGAAAVAAAVSGGIGGASVAEATTLGIRAAELGQRRGQWVAGAAVARRIAWAIGLVDTRHHDRSVRDIVELVGTSLATQESVPAAFAVLALHPEDPWQACLTAASLGGDSDTIAAMAGAIAGACHGMDAWPLEAVQTVRETNQLDLEISPRSCWRYASVHDQPPGQPRERDHRHCRRCRRCRNAAATCWRQAWRSRSVAASTSWLRRQAGLRSRTLARSVMVCLVISPVARCAPRALRCFFR